MKNFQQRAVRVDLGQRDLFLEWQSSRLRAEFDM